jgi:competence protein ComGC
LTTYNIHKRQAFIHPTGIEPAVPVSKRQQTYALDRAATVVSLKALAATKFIKIISD